MYFVSLSDDSIRYDKSYKVLDSFVLFLLKGLPIIISILSYSCCLVIGFEIISWTSKSFNCGVLRLKPEINIMGVLSCFSESLREQMVPRKFSQWM